MITQHHEQAKTDLKILYGKYLEENIVFKGSMDRCEEAYDELKLNMYQLFTMYIQYLFARKGYYREEGYRDDCGPINTPKLSEEEWDDQCYTPNELWLADEPWTFHFIDVTLNDKVRVNFLKDFQRLDEAAGKIVDIEEEINEKSEGIGQEERYNPDIKTQRKIAEKLYDDYYGYEPATFFSSSRLLL